MHRRALAFEQKDKHDCAAVVAVDWSVEPACVSRAPFRLPATHVANCRGVKSCSSLKRMLLLSPSWSSPCFAGGHGPTPSSSVPVTDFSCSTGTTSLGSSRERCCGDLRWEVLG